ncbi:MAG: hypothetical protein U0841_26565 [Chloroflexia bacterium]
MPLHRLAGPFLLTLGQGALYAYAAHLFLAALVHFGALVSSVAASISGGFPALPPPPMPRSRSVPLRSSGRLTRVRFLQGVAAPLGGAPFVRRGPGARLRYARANPCWRSCSSPW